MEAIGGYVATGRRQYGFDGIISHAGQAVDARGAPFAEELDLDTFRVRRVDAAQRSLAVIGKDLDHRLVDQDAQVEQFCAAELKGAGLYGLETHSLAG